MRRACAALALISAMTGRTAGRARSHDSDAGRLVSTGNMSSSRFDHAAALLPDGRVLVVGGIARNGVMQSSAEVFDPTAGEFKPTGEPQSAHGWGVMAEALPSGKVLVTGGSTGCDQPCYTDAAELYDPVTGTFARAGHMTTPRADARIVRLANGDILFVGGSEPSANGFATAELYAVGRGSFVPAGVTDIPDPTQAVLLKDGRVLVIGSAVVDVYDPSTQRFTQTGGLTLRRAKFGAALLPDGRVLVAGGQIGGPRGPRVTSTEIYDPRLGKFAAGPEMKTQRFKLGKAVVALKNGNVLIAGGAQRPEVYDLESSSFRLVGGAKLDGFLFSTATILTDGRVLLAGGYANPGGSGVSRAWLYEP